MLNHTLAVFVIGGQTLSLQSRCWRPPCLFVVDDLSSLTRRCDRAGRKRAVERHLRLFDLLLGRPFRYIHPCIGFTGK
jgi:hypothetical protein